MEKKKKRKKKKERLNERVEEAPLGFL